MIIANITTYAGQCSEAEHYYCGYHIIEEKTPTTHCMSSYDEIELKRKITSTNEVVYFNKKDSCRTWRIGSELNRFDSIEDIHSELIKLFGEQTIVTYYESQVFKEMLCYIDGVNIGYSFFGEVWSSIPSSCYKDLLPELDTIKIKCYECGQEYDFDEITEETEHMGRPLIKFLKKRDMDEVCCKYFDLIWNVIL